MFGEFTNHFIQIFTRHLGKAVNSHVRIVPRDIETPTAFLHIDHASVGWLRRRLQVL